MAFHISLLYGAVIRRGGRVLKYLLVLTVVTYVGLSCLDYSLYAGNKPGTAPPPCSETDEYRTILMDLAYKIHLILGELGVEHWLMYGSLWGPLRGIQEPLPWDFDVDYGINGSNVIFDKLTWEEFKAKFSAAEVRVFDKLKSSGSLTLRPKSSSANVDIYLYYDRGGYMMRSGYEQWLFCINYLLYHTFPSRLVQKPLPKVKFGHFKISVPREGIEIMKYLYRFNWWKVVKPVGCE